VVKGIQTGADDYIRKPFNHRELEARLHAGCRILCVVNRKHS
jgi:DNA-binding response OmpR family regulator